MAGVYISYPFCQQKCSFCNFASDVGSSGAREQYHAALLAEIRSHAWHWSPETVYFGGGTPSLMPRSLFTQIMAEIPRREAFRDYPGVRARHAHGGSRPGLARRAG